MFYEKCSLEQAKEILSGLIKTNEILRQQELKIARKHPENYF